MFRTPIALIILTAGLFLGVSDAHAQVELWLTDPGGSAQFEKQPDGPAPAGALDRHPTIVLDRTKTYQAIDGFGYTLTGGSAGLIARMDAASRKALLKRVVFSRGPEPRRQLSACFDRRHPIWMIASSATTTFRPGRSIPSSTGFSLAPDRAA